MRRGLLWSLAASVLLAGSVTTAAYAAGPHGTGSPGVTTQTLTIPTQNTAGDPSGLDLQSGAQQGSQSQTGVDTEKASVEANAENTTGVDPAGGQNVQQGSQSGAQDGAVGGQ